jgi:hypothetical protein
MRVYINAISSNQIKLYYTKFTPKVKTGQICIIHGYGESSDDYLPVMLHLFRWLSILPSEDMSSIWLTCAGLAILEA